MKKNANIIILLSVLIGLCSCSKSELDNKSAKGIITLSGVCIDEPTKTTIEGCTFSWEKEDQIGVFFIQPNGNINNACFIAKELKNNNKSATFHSSSSLDIDAGSSDKTIAGYYPYGNSQSSELTFSVDQIQKQNDKDADHLGQWDFMATPSMAWTSTIPTLTFKHLMAKVDFHFLNEYSSNLTINKIVMKPRNGKFHLQGSLDLFGSTGTPVLIPSTSNSVSKIGVETTGSWTTIAPGSTLTASMMLMPVNLSSDVIDITVFTDKGDFIYSKDGLDFLQQNNYNLSLSIKERILTATPTSIDFGESSTSSEIKLKSVNGQTSVNLSSDVNWITFSESTTVVPEYNDSNPATIKTITVTANRENLTKGSYSGKISVTSDAGNHEIPVTITVLGSEEVITCHDDLKFTLVSCTMTGTTAKVAFKVKNIGNQTITFQIRTTSSSSDSYAYDERGNQYSISSVNLGGTSDTYSISKDIPSDIEISGEIRLSNIDDLSSMLKYISVVTNFTPNLIMKNVAIEGRTGSPLPEPTTTGTVIPCSDNLEFTLLGCRVGANGTTVSFGVKNTSNTTSSLKLRTTSSSSDSYAYDERGNQYPISKVSIGMYSDGYSTSSLLPPDTYSNGYFVLSGVVEEATLIKTAQVKTNYSALLKLSDVAIEGR